MSVDITGYTEALINGEWHCIDFYQYDSKGKLHLIPSIQGRSLVSYALEEECKMDYINRPPDTVSDAVRRECSTETGVLLGPTEGEGLCSWSVVPGKWFLKANLALPESCGFFTRDALSWYLSNPEENRLDTDDMLSVEEYRELSEEEKKAYQYYEYTDPYGSRQILRSFKEAVLARVRAYNDNISWEMRENTIDLSDVRVLILHS